MIKKYEFRSSISRDLLRTIVSQFSALKTVSFYSMVMSGRKMPTEKYVSY